MLFLKEGPLGPSILHHAPLWWIWLSGPQAHNNKPEAVTKRESVSHRQSYWWLQHVKTESTGELRRFSSVPLDGLVLKTCCSDFLSCLLRAAFLELKFNFSQHYWVLSCKTNPGTQTARELRRETSNRSEIFSQKETISHLADTQPFGWYW